MSSLFIAKIGIAAGYQFDYVFDWTILKYPQIGSGSRGRVSTCTLLAPDYCHLGNIAQLFYMFLSIPVEEQV